MRHPFIAFKLARLREPTSVFAGPIHWDELFPETHHLRILSPRLEVCDQDSGNKSSRLHGVVDLSIEKTD